MATLVTTPLYGLRLACALAIFLHHFVLIFVREADIGFKQLALNAPAFMTAFFMLSGFLMEHLYAGGRRPFVFYGIRLARIYPAYLVALVLSWWIVRDQLGNLDPRVWREAFAIDLAATDLLLVNAWFPEWFWWGLKPVAWSLSCEVFFYALFPLLSRVLGKLTMVAMGSVALLLYLAAAVPAWIVWINAPDLAEQVPVYYAMPIFRLAEFTLGMVLCRWLTVRREPLVWPTRWVWPVMVAFGAYLGTMSVGSKLPVTHNAVAVLAFGILIASVCSAPHSRLARTFSAPGLRFWGNASYGLYLYQYPVMYLSYPYFYNRGVGLGWIFLFTFGLSWVLAIASYYLLERPVQRAVRRRTGDTHVPVATATPPAPTTASTATATSANRP